MKKAFLVGTYLFIALMALAQEEKPVSWQFTTKKISDNTWEIHMTASIADGWHIYAQKEPEGATCTPTSFSFGKNPIVSVTGATAEKGNRYTQRLEVLDMDLSEYTGSVDFIQVVKVRPGIKTSLKGRVTYAACNDKRCLPPKDETFEIPF